MHAKFGVLVTRPDTLAQPLLQALHHMNAKVWHFPTLQITFLTQDPSVQQAIQQLTAYTWQIFVSRHAVQAVMPQIIKTWSMLDLNQLHFAAVGPGTAQELKRFIHVDVIYPKAELGALALSHELADKMQASDTQMVWCGDKPSFVWPNARMVTCYLCQKNTVNLDKIQEALAAGEIQYILISSGTSLEYLMSALRELNACKLVVISRRLMKLAKTLGFIGEIILAKGADEQSMIHAIKGDLT